MYHNFSDNIFCVWNRNLHLQYGLCQVISMLYLNVALAQCIPLLLTLTRRSTLDNRATSSAPDRQSYLQCGWKTFQQARAPGRGELAWSGLHLSSTSVPADSRWESTEEPVCLHHSSAEALRTEQMKIPAHTHLHSLTCTYSNSVEPEHYSCLLS